MYVIIPIFCNKMEPMVEYVAENLGEVFDYFEEEFGLTSSQIYQKIYSELDTDTIGEPTYHEIHTELSDGDTFNFYHTVDKEKLLKMYKVSLPKCLHDKCHFVVHKVNGSMKNVWKEVQEHII